eukprot:9974938-Lingulodinium_polyedra.AAC.1
MRPPRDPIARAADTFPEELYWCAATSTVWPVLPSSGLERCRDAWPGSVTFPTTTTQCCSSTARRTA